MAQTGCVTVRESTNQIQPLHALFMQTGRSGFPLSVKPFGAVEHKSDHVNKTVGLPDVPLWMDVQCRTCCSIRDATRPLQLGQKEESIPGGSKGKHSASCHSGAGWDGRGVKRKASLGIEKERDVI